MPADHFLRVIDHPLMGRHLTVLRAEPTVRDQFRAAIAEAAILAYEAMRDVPVAPETVQTRRRRRSAPRSPARSW